jgi:hypothetical protein
MQLSDEEINQIQERINQLALEHRDLDEIITKLQHDPAQDQLQLSRLKKRKLALKDSLLKLESKLIPDLNA